MLRLERPFRLFDGSQTRAASFAQRKASFNKFMEGSFKEGFKAAINKGNKYNFWVGVSYLIGKTVALFSKTPDPYNPKPHTMWDTIREKYTFRLSSVIEGVAASTLIYDRLKNQKITLVKGGKTYPDFLGATGGGLFVSGFLIRLFAKFGVKEVNMDELNAHISDSLAKVPADKLPQAIAETTAFIKEHFKDKQTNAYHKMRVKETPEFGQIYNHLVTDLYRDHGISVMPQLTNNKPQATTIAAVPAATTPVPENMAKESKFADAAPKKSPTAGIQPKSLTERATAPQEAATAHGVA